MSELIIKSSKTTTFRKYTHTHTLSRDVKINGTSQVVKNLQWSSTCVVKQPRIISFKNSPANSSQSLSTILFLENPPWISSRVSNNRIAVSRTFLSDSDFFVGSLCTAVSEFYSSATRICESRIFTLIILHLKNKNGL